MKNLKILRADAGLNQRDMAQKLNIAKATYAHYESGRSEPSIETLFKLADYFNCSIDYLLGHEAPQATTGNTPLQKKLIYQISQLDEDLCEIAEATIEGLYVTNQERKIMREKVQNIQQSEAVENDV